MATTPSVDIVLVNWNSSHFIKKLLLSLEEIPDKRVVSSVTIVNNSIEDTELEAVCQHNWIFPVACEDNTHNDGFAKACNKGAKKNNSEYLLFLNPDVVLFENSILTCLDFLKDSNNKEFAACGIQLVDEQMNPSRSCARLPRFFHFFNSALGLNRIAQKAFPGILMKEFDHCSSREIDHIIGAFYFLRRKVFHEVGGFDERFFMYLEDLDLSQKIKSLGNKIFFSTEAKAIHIGGGSSEKIKAARISYAYSSRLLYVNKHFSAYRKWILFFLFIFVEPLIRSIYFLLTLSMDDFFFSLKGYFQFLLMVPKLLRNGTLR